VVSIISDFQSEDECSIHSIRSITFTYIYWMNNQTINKMSKLFNINLADLGKAALMVLIVTVLTAVYPAFSTGEFPTGVALLAALKSGVTGGVAYIIKNLLTNSNGNFATSENK
jgi:hypothetical protein